MNALNVMVLGGHLGADPRIGDINGRKVMNLNVAVNRGKDATDWIPVRLTGPQVTDYLTQNLKKGSCVLVEGRFEHISYEDKAGVRKDFSYLEPTSPVRMTEVQLNSICVEGNLTKDPETRQTASGKTVVNLTIACNRSYKTKEGEWKELPTSYLDVTLWDNTAEYIAKNAKKGDTIFVNGYVQSSTFTAKDGQKRTSYSVVGNRVSLNSREKKASNAATAEPAQNSAAPVASAAPAATVAPTYSANDFAPVEDEDLPF